MKLVLRIDAAGSDGSSERVTLERFPATVGRHAESEVRLDDPRSSRRHAMIEIRDGRPFLVDLGSGNGTRVNGLETRECFLSRGDEIRIGGHKLRVETVEAVRERRDPDETASGSTAEIAGRRLRRRRLVTRLAPVGILLVAASLLALWLVRGESEGPSPETRAEARYRAARETLERLRRVEGTAAAVTPALLEEVDRVRREFSDVEFPGGGEPFADLLESVRSRQKMELSNRIVAAERRASELIEAERYREAMELAAAEAKSVAEWSASLTLAGEALQRRVRSAIAERYQRLRSELDLEAGYGHADDALRAGREALEDFAGTPQESSLRMWIAEAEARLREAEERREEALARIESVRLEVSSASDDATSRSEAARPRAPGLFALLAPKIADGVLRDRSYELGEVRGAPAEVVGDGSLVVRAEDGSSRLPLSAIAPRVQLEMARDALDGEDLLKAALFGFLKEVPGAAEELLWKYVSEGAGERSERQAEVNRLLAKVRGLSEIPEGGYAYDPRHGWEDTRQRAEREIVSKAARIGDNLVSLTTEASLERRAGELLSLLDDERLAPEARGEIRGAAIRGLSALRERLSERISSLLKKSGFVQLRLASEELKRRRSAALKVIFDASVYLPENHPDYPKGDKVNGQEAVDQAVGAVRELWDNAASYAVQVDSGARKYAGMIRAIDESYLPRLRHRPEPGSGTIDELLLNLDHGLDLKHFAVTREEVERYRYNRKVEAYNRALNDAELPDADREHVVFLNDYREMMGLRRLLIDSRLCRATRKHSAACNAAGSIWHNGPDGSPSSRAQAEGFPGGVAENVAIGYANPKDIWTRGWYRASDHHRNALGAGHNTIGYGYVGRVGTQNFASATVPFQ